MSNSCGTTSDKSDKQSNFEIATRFIEDFQPEKAIPFLKKVKPNDPDYEIAQELLKTIGALYEPKAELANSSVTSGLNISDEEKKRLTIFQNKWAKEQIASYHSYFIDYNIENLTTINFVLSKEASETGSLSGHEDTHVPILINQYNEALKKK